MRIDNFALTMFQSCPAKFDLRMNHNWTTRNKSAALGFGGAIHAGLAAWYRTGSRQAMLTTLKDVWPDGMPVDDYRSLGKAVEVLMAYVKEYPAENFDVIEGVDGKMIECNFTLPTGMYLSCFTCGATRGAWIPGKDAICGHCGGPLELIEYGGIFDGLVGFSGTVYVLEHKTTSQLGPYYFNQFRPNNQVTGYVWGAGLLSGQRVGGAFINAMGVYKSSATKFARQITVRSDMEIAEWLQSVHATCEAIQQCHRTGIWPLHTVSCMMYGKCEFHEVHTLPHPQQRLAILEQEYIKSHWDYEGRDE